MKFLRKYFVSIFLVITLLVNWATPAYAAQVINSVAPNLVFNDVATTITVTGSGFVSGAVVSLKNYGVLSTSFDKDTQLKAVVRPGIPASTYTVVVTNPDLTFTEYPNGLTVADPSPLPTSTPIPTSTPPAFGRPQLVVASYKINDVAVQTGKEFNLKIKFENAGTTNAINAQAVFSSADVVPTDTGGVVVVGSLVTGEHVEKSQTFIAVNSVYGKSVIVIDVVLTYYDEKGTAYTDKFTLSLPAYGATSDTIYPTATPTGVNSAQLVITSYGSTVDPLQPGEQFQLGVTVENMGNTTAKNVTMIIGGGSSGTNSGTPQPGGVSGSSGEFTNFAPVGSSNIQSLGDIPAGGGLQVLQNLVVNVSTSPGAYPMKITFSYVNGKGEVVNDDQVITLLVYSLPNLDVSFYSPPETFFIGQPGALPIQIVNLGKRSVVLGNMTIETKDGMIDPDSSLVGSLDPGGYFTFDSTLTPDVAGPMELNVTIEYTDDFNQPRTVTSTLNVTVEEAFIEPTPDPTMEGADIYTVTDETFTHKIWRFALGLFGLDSAPPSAVIPADQPLPGKQMIPIPGGGGGGKG